jgi:hypothetical protein
MIDKNLIEIFEEKMLTLAKTANGAGKIADCDFCTKHGDLLCNKQIAITINDGSKGFVIFQVKDTVNKSKCFVCRPSLLK